MLEYLQRNVCCGINKRERTIVISCKDVGTSDVQSLHAIA